MNPLLLLAVFVLLPIILIIVLKVNAAIAFMSLCLGSVLVTYTSSDATDLVASFAPKGSLNVLQWMQFALLTAPFLLAILFTRKSVKGASMVINLLPAIASGLLYALLAIPLLSKHVQQTIHSNSLWTQLNDLQTAVVLGGAVFSLLFILLSHRSHRKAGDEKHGKH